MTTQNSNRVSLVIAILAILLILGGVFLLNQSQVSDTATGINDGKLNTNFENDGVKILSDKSTGSAGKTSGDKITEPVGGKFPTDTNTTGSTTSTTTATTISPKIEETPKPTTTTPITQTPAPQPTAPKETPKPEEKKIDLSNIKINQFAAKITNVSGNRYSMELTGCGIANALYCKPGTVITLYSLTNFTDKEVNPGSNWLFTGNFSEDQKGLFVGTLSSMQQL
jgi:cytoskeletal protein RodZ